MLYWMCEKSGLPPTWPQLEHAIRRNFGGMESDELDTLEEFKQQIHNRCTLDLQSIPQKVHTIDLKIFVVETIFIVCSNHQKAFYHD